MKKPRPIGRGFVFIQSKTQHLSDLLLLERTYHLNNRNQITESHLQMVLESL